ncbi:beta-lactamase [Candidatus Francisella endociliophora]|uniref:Beta-lactamase n=1 Tax=Candidatus Francisella endociliophora TaxID=653937 RepID=A0A097EQQ6_9GAMM|nr:serine hydrolase [Francisella sp. FSC1006]AIT09897.1 beta-lactamase [Francisella sp. FSC1006]
MSFTKLESIINYDVVHGFPGVALSIIYHGENIYQNTFGYAYRYDRAGKQVTDPQILDKNMLFDIASLTKIFATTYAIMYLYERNLIKLNALITEYIPEFKFVNTSYIPTIRDLLNHASGVAPFFDFYNNYTAGDLYSQDRETTIKYLKTKMSVVEPARKYCIYSDIGMKILGCVVEAITNQRLDNFLVENIYSKLELKNTCFNPLEKGYLPEQIVATQVDGHANFGTTSFNNIKTDTLRGLVHDEKALYSMDGVAGHAGLFSTIDDVARLASLLYQENEFFSQSTIKEFSEYCDVNPAFTQGFWTAKGRKNRSLFGEKCSDKTIGHTGFTGQCFISDPENKITIIIMSNSVHCRIIYPRIFEGKTFRTGLYGQLIDSIYESLNI